MPERTPRAPLPLLAIALSPFAWLYGRPDLFDSYRCNMINYLVFMMAAGCRAVALCVAVRPP